MAGYTLGLDLGTTSIGWALVRNEPDPNGGNIVAGVRVFPEGVDRETSGREASKNETRRIARGMRRQHERKARRKRRLKSFLKARGLLPQKAEDLQVLFTEDPYLLRKRGLDEDLTPHEFGRALVNLNQRRGFKSNRKEQSKEDGVVYEGINALREEINNASARTLGEYLASHRENETKVRSRYLLRDMLRAEFDTLWERQSKAHPQLLTPDLKGEIGEAIFFQRPLKPADHLIGFCELEPDERRCPRANYSFQRFRLLQEVNNLRILLPDGRERKLNEEPPTDERQKLVGALSKAKEIKNEKIVEMLGLDRMETLNLENAKRTKLDGNKAEYSLRKVFKKDYDTNPDFYAEAVFASLIEDEEEEFAAKARMEWNLSEEQIEGLFKELSNQPKGYSNYSLKAIKMLLPYLEAGDHLADAKRKAGYDECEETQLLDCLPLPSKVVPNMTNPIVRKALYEVRKVVNAIIREYGKPGQIIVELARDTKGNSQERNDQLLENKKRERERERIKELLKSQGLPNPSNTDVLKYQLWQECREICPFTGRSIGFDALFRSGEVQIEHILPYSRSLDDSPANKTLCFSDENIRKGNRTPFEAYSENAAVWEELLVRIKEFPYRKRMKFTQKEIELDKCIERQLNDTRYISRQVRSYLQSIVAKVNVTRGQVTAELRWRWGLDKILNPDGDFKNRDDHRHHSIDAVVTALTTHSHLQKLSQKYRFKNEKIPFPYPWEGFREEVEHVVEDIVVSHRPTRKISGALHEETNYGLINSEKGKYVYRKPLKDLTAAMVEKIRDERIRRMAQERLEAHGGDPKKAFAEPLFLPNKNGPPVPVRTVRLETTGTNLIGAKDPDGNVYRYVQTGSNHHISIFEFEVKGKVRREGVVTTMFEAAQIAAENGKRRKKGVPDLPIIRRVHPDRPDAKFLYSLCKNDMVTLETSENGKEICRVQTMSVEEKGNSRTLDIRFRLHIAAKIDSVETLRRIRSLDPSKVKIIKVTADSLGRVSEAND